MSEIKVLNVLLDGRLSGPARRILEVGTRILEKGIETVLVVPDGENDLVQEAQEKDVRISNSH